MLPMGHILPGIPGVLHNEMLLLSHPDHSHPKHLDVSCVGVMLEIM